MTSRLIPSALVPLLALAAAPAAGQQLSPQEQAIVRSVDAHAADAVNFLERIVNINSGTLNPQGVREVGRHFQAPLDSLGFDVRWIGMPDSLNRAGHLFAYRTGTQGRRVLLIGHLDTVFEKDDAFQRFVREGRFATGPGVNDMKGGDVVILYALRALHAAGALEGTTVTVALTGDEESAGRPLEISRRHLIEAGRNSGAALEFETGSRDSLGEYAVVARRSSSGWTLRVRGRTGHSSGVFGEGSGSGAIFEAARTLNAFHEELRGEPNLTFNPGVIVGGTDVEYDPQRSAGTAFGKTNVIAQTAIVTGDIRTLTDEQLQRTRERMTAIVARHLPRTEAEITFGEGYPSMPPTEGNQALLDVLNTVNCDLGTAPMQAFDPGRRGAADVSFVAPYTDALAGLGVHGSGAHGPNERIDLETLPLQIKRAALLIYRLTR
ncbi:MAG TPA: M20/M25/M40 family metallo-hydrolase [Longimicrobium sp.]|uniref:M20/M25/M40 family metallo-hydrolase n=1 Tax=Longimicrobium sp. TaxID=2029185 RepID=UPI002ED8A912